MRRKLLLLLLMLSSPSRDDAIDCSDNLRHSYALLTRSIHSPAPSAAELCSFSSVA